MFATNIAFVFVNFYRDIAVANDVRPRFRQTNGLIPVERLEQYSISCR